MRLYELVDDLDRLLSEDDIPDDVLADTLDGLRGEIDQKAEQIALCIKDAAAEAAAMKAEEENLKKRRLQREKLVERLKYYLSRELLRAGVKKVETPRCKLTFRSAKVVKFDDESEFVRWAKMSFRDDLLTFAEPKASKTAIMAAIESGEDIPGARIEDNQNIQIK